MKKTLLAFIGLWLAAVVQAQELRALFLAENSYSAYYTQNFDSEAEFSDWSIVSTNSSATWGLAPGLGRITFNTVDPSNKMSLVLDYSKENQYETATSPALEIKPDTRLEYYNYFSPNFLIWGAYKLYATDVATGEKTELLNQFLWAQNEGYDEEKWKKFDFDLSNLAGKKVRFSFVYEGSDGESELIDAFRLVTVDKSENAKITIFQGETVNFVDDSEGNVSSWNWEFEGGYPATSSERNPSVKYDRPGVYSVKLTVGDGKSTSVAVREGYVTVYAQKPTAVIGMPADAYLSPFVALFVPTNTPVMFTDKSTGSPTEWFWQFVGGTPSESTVQNPTVEWKEKGLYSFALTTINEAGSANDIYQYGLQAGGAQYVWNIAPEENQELAEIKLGWYGNYAGSNWLGMQAFAEYYKEPLAAATIDSLDIYFFSGKTVSPDADITVSICKTDGDDGAPGTVLGSKTIKAGDIKVDQQTFVPTRVVLDRTVDITGDFFIVVEGIPNNTDESTYETDDISIALVHREAGSVCTTWHLLENQDDQGNPTGGSTWYKNVDEAVSLCITPVITYDKIDTSMDAPRNDGVTGRNDAIYTLQGLKVAGAPAPGIYIRGGKKFVVR
ncbi:PKD domain-containing protein [Xylanibacter muris]|uniref:PKD domain-containing protein n=1 Tax=Xylanibacter muris TaxID=2736290 RepID=A0ABX2AJZ5_9BACT|nr:PKD domain-containing protein [Xylanibacter muris]NPD91050.1 PKD domain-containing protein [Xylanibacter muris]